MWLPVWFEKWKWRKFNKMVLDCKSMIYFQISRHFPEIILKIYLNLSKFIASIQTDQVWFKDLRGYVCIISIQVGRGGGSEVDVLIRNDDNKRKYFYLMYVGNNTKVPRYRYYYWDCLASYMSINIRIDMSFSRKKESS